MDFLTQPFTRPALHPVPPPPDSSSSSHASTSAPPSPSTPSAPTTPPSTTHSTHHLQHISRFSALRTADDPSLSPSGLPGEERVRYPSEKEGDWKAFGRVAAGVIVWDGGEGEDEGEAGKVEKGERALREDQGEESIVEGQLWITRENRLLLLLDRSFPPLAVDRSFALEGLSRTTSRVGGGGTSLLRRLSFGTGGGGGEGGASLSRRRSSASSSASGGGGTELARTLSRDNSLHDPDGGGSGGLTSKFKKLVTSVLSPNTRSGTGGAGEKEMSRTKSIEIGKRRASERGEALRLSVEAKREEGKGKERERERDEGGEEEDGDVGEGRESRGALRFEEPSVSRGGRGKETPLPEYRGYSITALSLPLTPSTLHAVRFYPHRVLPPSSSSAYTSPFATDDDPISCAAIAASPTAEEAVTSPSMFEGEGRVRGPVVEVDVKGVRFDGGEGEAEGNRGREVTVGFVFKELLLAQEATTFQHRLLPFLPDAVTTTIGTPPAPASSSPPFVSFLSRTISANRSSSPPPPSASAGAIAGGGSTGGGFGAALLRTLSGGTTKGPSPSTAGSTSSAGAKEGQPPNLGENERRRSSFRGLLRAGGGEGGNEGAEPTT